MIFTSTGEEAFRAIYLTKAGKQTNIILWNKVYKRELFNRIEYWTYKQSLPQQYFEDNLITPLVLRQARKVAFTSEKLYFYRQREGSLKARGFGPYKAERAKVYFELAKLCSGEADRTLGDYLTTKGGIQLIKVWMEAKALSSADDMRQLCLKTHEEYSEIYPKLKAASKGKIYYPGLCAFPAMPGGVLFPGQRILFQELFGHDAAGMKNMDVSVIIPVFNRSECLQRAVDSVQAQATGLSLELIIVDDGSTDRTGQALERIKLLSGIPCTVLVNETRLGAAAARNRGAGAACGKYLAFLDSDDEWLPAHIESKLAAMQKAGAQGAYGTFFSQSRYSRVLRDFDERDENHFSMADYILLGKGDARTSTFVFDRTAFLEFGFDINLKKHQDWDLAIRFAQARPFALDKTPTVVLHTEGKDRMSGANDPGASALFMEKHNDILSDASKARMYTNLALRTLRYEGKNDDSREYLKLARQFSDKRNVRLLFKRTLLGLPLCNSVRIGDYCRDKYKSMRFHK
jgi:glycosyltransferase involved in cell wall biosynthesis